MNAGLGPVQDLVWLPESLGPRVAEALHTRLADWAAAWGLPAPGQAEVQRLEAGVTASVSVVDLLASPTAEWRSALAQAVFKQAAADSAIVEGVVRRMLEALREALSPQCQPSTPPQPGRARPGHHGLLVTLDLLGRRCGFFMDLEALRAGGWLTRPQPAALAPVNAERACAHLPVPLVAELGHAHLSVSDLLQLGEGDVLVLDEALTASLRIHSPGSSLQLTAHLGATSDNTQRAARWVNT